MQLAATSNAHTDGMNGVETCSSSFVRPAVKWAEFIQNEGRAMSNTRKGVSLVAIAISLATVALAQETRTDYDRKATSASTRHFRSRKDSDKESAIDRSHHLGGYRRAHRKGLDPGFVGWRPSWWSGCGDLHNGSFRNDLVDQRQAWPIMTPKGFRQLLKLPIEPLRTLTICRPIL